MPGYIYIIHLDRPLEHARHYAGSTNNLLSRLVRHAKGHGSTMLSACKQRGIEWKLAGLMLAEQGTIQIPKGPSTRALERHLHNQRHDHRFCEICMNGPITRLKGCTPIDISLLTFPLTSTELRRLS